MSISGNSVFTIGHSTHSTEAFLALLCRHGVEAVADVRSSPFSRFNPQFNRETLEQFLKAHGIRYVFLGKELGARSEDRSCYLDGRVQYARLAQTALFQSGLDRVLQDAARYRVALMCSEKEPLECHRTLLVAKALEARGQPVLHIHADGHLETHEAAMERLLEVTGVPNEDFFRSSGLDYWILTVRFGLEDMYGRYPWIAYGTDWLAFGHIVIALFFIGPMVRPAESRWTLYAGLAACVLVLPLALICGAVRGIPMYWRLIDCSFGIAGSIPLLYCLRLLRYLGKR